MNNENETDQAARRDDAQVDPAQRLVDAVFRELGEQQHDGGEIDLHDCSALPVVEAECAWAETGLIWSGYPQSEIVEICTAIAAQVALSLAVGGYLRRAPLKPSCSI